MNDSSLASFELENDREFGIMDFIFNLYIYILIPEPGWNLGLMPRVWI